MRLREEFSFCYGFDMIREFPTAPDEVIEYKTNLHFLAK